ncbi:hypothetical protein [Streptomyces antarcticus]|uniref:hypothetical protein n=1 Tax=Streptomyces antarcticus TaxID=2996458 RepID=UPI00227064DC|nr:hypothetical protein [Streptomyces sp. H34-AA3]MCY0946318.1 hypothetical protein [Streptomyces sp. H34-AA3]
MTAGNIPTISCDFTDEAATECDQEWFSPVSMPHHRALRAWLRERGWRRLRDGSDLCPGHAQRPSISPTPRPQSRTDEGRATT